MVLTTALGAVVFFWVTGPPAARRFTPSATDGRTVRGAFHIHTSRSDGARPKADVAAAAARAGLQFAIFTDHGNGVPPPDPPIYIDGVLCVDAVEVSTNDGHYIAMGHQAAPYPLGGDGAAVVEDVARLGGFGVAAHPTSSRAELQWADWDAPFDGIEWLNGDSEWRDESRLRLARGLVDYLWRPAGALAGLLDRPVESLRRWDRLTTVRPVVALAGHDAHGGIGAESDTRKGRRLHVPSYEATFRTFSLYVSLPRPLTGDPAADAEALIAAVRRGAHFTAIDARGTPPTLQFRGTLGAATIEPGSALPPGDGVATFNVKTVESAGATIVLRRNGDEIARSSGGVLTHQDSRPGAYRVEVGLANAPGAIPWLVSNPIYRFTPVAPLPPPAVRLPVLELGEWHVESDPESSGSSQSAADDVRLTYRLKSGTRSSQFVALVSEFRGIDPGASAVLLRARASQPMRLSVQLRFNGDADRRWGRSIYLDASDREVVLPLGDLRYRGPADRAAAAGAVPLPPVTEATSLLLVVDLTNALPGSAGWFAVSRAALAR